MQLSALIKNKKEREEIRINLERVFEGESFNQTHKFVVEDRIDYALLRYHPIRNTRGDVIAAGIYAEVITEIITLKQQDQELIQQSRN